MHRRPLLRLLERYRSLHPDEGAVVDRMDAFVRAHPDCFERSCLEGHITGSAWVLSPDHRSVLLTHHVKLGRWLQLGGHSDGEPDPLKVAMREAAEESGMSRFSMLGAEPEAGEATLPLDLDVHAIPARGTEPAHFHHDVRYLLVAAEGQTAVASAESRELRWVERKRLGELLTDDSVLRLEAKTRRLLGER